MLVYHALRDACPYDAHRISEELVERRRTMSREENIKVANAFFEAFNAHDLSKGHPYEADDLVLEAPGAPGPLNRQQARMYNQAFVTAFPDGHFEVHRTLVDGDYVVTHWTGSGTNTGPLVTPTGQTIPPTGRKGMVSGVTISEVKNGKVTRGWSYWDQVALLTQLGLMPPPR
jgi:steroid delta-isomerase-like uncharacterized protein